MNKSAFTMRNYNTRDAKSAVEELDPCIAAEIRMKDEMNSNRTLRYAIAVAVLLVLLTVATVLLVLFLTSSGSPDFDPENDHSPTRSDNFKHPVIDSDSPTAVQSSSEVARARGEITATERVAEANLAPNFVPMTPFVETVQPDKESSERERDGLERVVPAKPESAVPEYHPPTSAPFVPVSTKERPKFIPQPTKSVEAVTYATRSDEIPDIVPSFSSIDDHKYDFIETDDVHSDCEAYKKAGHTQSGVYEIRVADQVFHALCLMEADYAWMVLQRRSGDTISFNRTFEEYASGFGPHSQDHWLGLEKVATYVRLGHRLQLRVELRGDRCREAKKCSGLGAAGYWWADWNFSLGPRESGYRLTIEPALHGNLSDSSKDLFFSLNNGQPFTTFDRDNDNQKTVNCATFRNYGPWWHKDCTFAALNGHYDDDKHRQRGLFWLYQRPDTNHVLVSYTIKPEKTLMKFRIKP